MAGGGSMQSMNTVIKNNRNLLKKNRTFLKNKKDLFKESGGEVEFKKLSKVELVTLKEKIRKKLRKESIKNNISLGIIIVIMFSGLVYFGYVEHKKEIIYKKAVIEQEKKYRFTRIIKSADFYLGREKLERTLKQYKFAKKLYPNDSLVNSRIKLVDSLIRVNYQIEK